MELKLLEFQAVELKLSDDNLAFAGYASVFNGVDAYGDTVLPGAFAETIKNRSRPIRMHYNHDPRTVIGKWVDVAEDGKGLFMKGELTPGHSLASDVRASMKHGTVDGLSIGYRVPSGGSAKAGKVRQLKRIDLVEVSIVTTPADLNARILPDSIKSAVDSLRTLRDIEQFLRDTGWSRGDAEHFVKRCKSVIQGEPEGGGEGNGVTAGILGALQSFKIG